MRSSPTSYCGRNASTSSLSSRQMRPELPIHRHEPQKTLMTLFRRGEGAFDTAEALRSQRAGERVGGAGGTGAQGRAQRAESERTICPLIGGRPRSGDLRVIARQTQTDLTEMISGESGTGKDLWRVSCTITAVAQRSVRRHQHGCYPRELMKATVRARERGLHGPIRACRAASSRRKGAPCSSTRSVTSR